MLDDQNPEPTPPPSPTADELNELLGESEDPLESEIVPKPVESQAVAESVAGSLAEQAPPGELQKLIGRFMEVADTVLSNHNQDRAQIETAISYLDSIVQLGSKAPRVYVEMWVAAMRTKSETTANAVKLLDSLAKLLSAGKGTQIFVGQQNINSSNELVDLLKTPEFPDEK